MSEPQRVSQQELEPLSPRARLALAARCVRRARALLPGPQSVLERALALVEQASRSAAAEDELADAAAGAYTLALNHLDSGGGPAAGADDDRVVVTCMVAHAAAFAAEAATVADPRRAAQLVGQSIDFAIHALRIAGAPNAADEVAAMRHDLRRLREAAAGRGWDDQTPVPADFFAAAGPR